MRRKELCKTIFKLIIIAILIVIIILLIGYAWSRYISQYFASTNVDIAKWSFDYKILENDESTEIENFAVTRTDSNLEAEIGTLAPGTSGEFVLEIDATGTEVWLTYDAKFTFTNKPNNLKMYLDREKTQELILENNTYYSIYGFMDNENGKKKDTHVYWDWQLETGETEEQKQENNELDTSFYGKTMKMKIDVIRKTSNRKSVYKWDSIYNDYWKCYNI